MGAVCDDPGFGRKRQPQAKADPEPQPKKKPTPVYRPTDAGLRAFGFRIASRPEGSPPTWRRGDEVYGQAEAHRIAYTEYTRLLGIER